MFGKSGDSGDVIDEIERHKDTRIVGACSAFMALRGYPELYMDPPVRGLVVHLPDGQQLTWADTGMGHQGHAMERVVKSSEAHPVKMIADPER